MKKQITIIVEDNIIDFFGGVDSFKECLNKFITYAFDIKSMTVKHMKEMNKEWERIDNLINKIEVK